MHILITGAGGFVGQALVRRLLDGDAPLPQPLQRLTVHDLALDGLPDDPRLVRLTGNITDTALVQRAFETPVDWIYHLASVPGGTAERNLPLGLEVNIGATIGLLEAARRQAEQGRTAVFTFASTIGALGAPLPVDGVDDDTPCTPNMSYGAQKLCGEILVADYTRRGAIDGRSVRLSGIVSRPGGVSGLLSAFMSNIIRELAAGRPFDCPVSPESTVWLMSVPCIVDNLLHAGRMDGRVLGAGRVCTLPALQLSMGELAQAIGAAYGRDVAGLVRWQSNPALEENFGRFPTLRTALAERAGFRHDGDARTLALRALSLD